MIKTEYFDEVYTEINPENASIIVQSIFDDNGNLQKKIEWHQKKKTGYLNSNIDSNNKIRFEFLSQTVKNHYLENVMGIQRIIDLLWNYHAREENLHEKRKILESILDGYGKIGFAISSYDFELRRDKEDHVR